MRLFRRRIGRFEMECEAVPSAQTGAPPTANTNRQNNERDENLARLSALRDFAFFVRMMLPAHRAELRNFELLGHRPLVLGGRVVGAAAFAAGHLDNVSHSAAEVTRGAKSVKRPFEASADFRAICARSAR
jgi:hypothetical protein